MRNRPEAPRQRRLQFDPLESRQLLHGGLWSAAPVEVMARADGVAAAPQWQSGFAVERVGPAAFSPAGGAGWWGPAASMEPHAYDGPAGFGGIASFAGPPPGGGRFGGPSGWNGEPGPGSTSEVGPTSPVHTDVVATGGYLIVYFTYSPPTNATGANASSGAGGPASVPAPSPANAGLPNSPAVYPSGGRDPGDPSPFARTQEPGAFSPAIGGQGGGLSVLFPFPRDRPSASEISTTFAGPVIVAPAAGGSGVLAVAAFDPAAAVTPTAGGPAPQFLPATSTVPVPSASMIVPDGSGGARATAAMAGAAPRVDANDGIDPARVSRSSGRHALAATLHHPLPASLPANLGPAAAREADLTPSPRGADLIAEALPLLGDSLERSLDKFVRDLAAGEVAALASDGRTPIVAVSLALLSAAASAVMVREVLRRRSMRGRGPRLLDPLGRELALSFPELPRSWSETRR
jgi:hypothetical protein